MNAANGKQTVGNVSILVNVGIVWNQIIKPQKTKTMATTFHYLSDITIHGPENYIYTCQPFDPVKLKQAIIEYLENHPKAEIEHTKDSKTYESFESLNFYQLNKNGKPCRVIFKGTKQFLKPLG